MSPSEREAALQGAQLHFRNDRGDHETRARFSNPARETPDRRAGQGVFDLAVAKKLYGVGALNWGDLVATAPAQVQVVTGPAKDFPDARRITALLVQSISSDRLE
jgi:hypothetical protein